MANFMAKELSLHLVGRAMKGNGMKGITMVKGYIYLVKGTGKGISILEDIKMAKRKERVHTHGLMAESMLVNTGTGNFMVKEHLLH